MREAQLEDVGSGLAPISEGWFVVNLRDAAWLTNESFGARCVFEGGMPALRKRPDLPPHRFAQLGITLQVLQPGQASGLYHAETNQEGFLVLAGECLLHVQDDKRQLRAWDFFHCPPGTAHSFVGAGDAPCVIFMTGARTREKDTVYPRSDLPASQVYDAYPHWQPERPANWGELPWAQAWRR
jgi:quercetin dioxygenase-like cupin family protein